MEDFVPMLSVLPGLVAGIVVVLTRRHSARVFWSVLGITFAVFTAIFAWVQIGNEVMNGPLSTALLVIMIPAAVALSVGRCVKKWPLLAIPASLLSYALAFLFTLSFGVNLRWLGK